ncbi:MAG: hypothetical protein ABSG86_22515 [Thermoguttaceae bacterium]|jgi:hypothetical protein
MLLSNRLRELIDAAFTGLWVQTYEPDEAIKEIQALAAAETWQVVVKEPDPELDPVAVVRALLSLESEAGKATLLVLPNFTPYLGDPVVKHYPPTLVGLLDVAWEFPSLAPPEWLLTRNPELYQQQAARIAARFDEAARMAEDAFLTELAGLVQTLQDKLAGKADGVAKRLHDTNVSDLREFFEKFRRLNIHSNEALDEIVTQAEKALTCNGLFDLGGVIADQLRESPALRQAVSTRLSAVGAQLDGLMVDRPRRAINRRPKASDGEQE